VTELSLLDLEQWTAELFGKLERFRYRNELELFKVLLFTGLRVREVLERDRLNLLSNGNLLVYLEKNSGQRQIVPSVETDYLFKHANDSEEFKFNLSYATYNNQLKFARPYPAIYQEKDVTTHIFRKIYARRLIQGGATLGQVQTLLNVSSTAVTKVYTEGVINRP